MRLRPAIHGVAILIAAAVLVACAPRPQLTGTQIRPRDVLSVTIVDETGWVRSMAILDVVDPTLGSMSVENAPGRDDVLLVSWVGGRCADPPIEAVITLAPRGARIALSVLERWILQGCGEDIGVFRQVSLELDRPVTARDVDAVRVDDRPRDQ